MAQYGASDALSNFESTNNGMVTVNRSVVCLSQLFQERSGSTMSALMIKRIMNKGNADESIQLVHCANKGVREHAKNII